MATRVLRKPCYGLAEVCARWGVTEPDIANFVVAGELTLSVVVVRLPLEEGWIEEVDEGQFVNMPEQQRWFTGTLDLWPQDAWQVVTAGGHAVSSFRADGDRYRSVWARWDEAPDFLVPRERLVVRHDEMERFEAAQAALAVPPASAPAIGAGRGAPARYDWDEFWCEAALVLQVDGMPETQAALVRRMERWFAGRGQFPDQSTIKKKVALLWRRHAEALARLPA
jgi:hypothetical protein